VFVEFCSPSHLPLLCFLVFPLSLLLHISNWELLTIHHSLGVLPHEILLIVQIHLRHLFW
jgi:hypothetical protein